MDVNSTEEVDEDVRVRKGLPVKAIRVMNTHGEVLEIPVDFIVKDGFDFDPEAQYLTLTLFAEGVQIVTPLTLRREAEAREAAE